MDEDVNAHSDGMPHLISAERVAAVMGVSRKDVYSMVHREEIPARCIVRLGRRLRFYADRLTSWFAENEGYSRKSAK